MLTNYQPDINLLSLPPATTAYPATNLSVLKHFVENNGYKAEIKYLNIQLAPITSELAGISNDTENYRSFHLIPVLLYLAQKQGDNILYNKILANIYNYQSKKRIPHFERFNKKAVKILEKIDEIIYEQIIKEKYCCFWGISARYEQWVLGEYIASQIKKLKTDDKCVIGGFETRSSALEMMKICKNIDFAVWGEGEYPLLELLNCIQNDSIKGYEEVDRLVYRKGAELISTKKNNRFLKFSDYPKIIHKDFAKLSLDKINEIFITIECSRSCSWRRCKFCGQCVGQNYRKRNPDDVVNDIEMNYLESGVKRFSFSDLNLINDDLLRFDLILDKIIALSERLNVNFTFGASIIPWNLTSEIIKKMAIAGFIYMTVGYESLSDRLLRKMDKKTSFADNILVAKYFVKYGIKTELPVIMGIPGETSEEVVECINNLYFMRYFLGNSSNSLYHKTIPYALIKPSRFYNEVAVEERNLYKKNSFIQLLPPRYLDEEFKRFENFDFTRDVLVNQFEWDSFIEIDKKYKSNHFYYQIFPHGDQVIYKEYYNDTLLQKLPLSKEYWFILKESDSCVTSIDKIYEKSREEAYLFSKDDLIRMISELKKLFLLFCNDDMSQIVSIIDTEK